MKNIDFDIDEIYRDQNIRSSQFYDRRVTSAWLPYGIKCIDSELSRRIQNIGEPVKHLVYIDRVQKGYCRYEDEYVFLPLDKDYKCFDRTCFVYDDEPKYTEYERKKWGSMVIQRDLICPIYTYTHPVYVAKYKGENPKALRNEIANNPHLHTIIKQNLLGNLESRLKKNNE